jgi:hypothetical protein
VEGGEAVQGGSVGVEGLFIVRVRERGRGHRADRPADPTRHLEARFDFAVR